MPAPVNTNGCLHLLHSSACGTCVPPDGACAPSNATAKHTPLREQRQRGASVKADGICQPTQIRKN